MQSQWQRKYKKLMAQLSQVGFVCNGSIRENYQKCGKLTCSCAQDDQEKHGPYYIWSLTKKGQQTCRSFSEQQAVSFRQCNHNYQKMKAIADQLCELVANAIIKRKF
jgi:hypothetical protein